jgi:hypothetical protein
MGSVEKTPQAVKAKPPPDGDGNGSLKLADLSTLRERHRARLVFERLAGKAGNGASANGKDATVAALAAAKGLRVAFLHELDVEDLTGGGVSIAYFDLDGSELFRRERDRPGGPRFRQPAGVHLRPYGLWRLDEARRVGHCYLTEGESDSWALWSSGLPALGLPGANAAGCLDAEHLSGLDTVYLLPDADEAGERLVDGVARRLEALGWDGKLYRVRLPEGIKDVCDWFVRASALRDGFVREMADAVSRAEAVPFGSGSSPRVRMGTETAGPPSGFPAPIPCSQLKEADPEREQLWAGCVARAGTTLFSALPKVGKTTVLAHALKALERGGDFCGLSVSKGAVLYVTEESEARWAERRDAIGLGDHVDFQVRPFLARPTLERWGAFLDHLLAVLDKKPADLVVFDTLSNLWPVTNENDAAEVGAALMPLHALTAKGVAVLLVHHLRKSDGPEGTGARGSGALSAFVDTVLELRRYDADNRGDRRRLLTGYSRCEGTPEDFVIELAADGSGYTAQGDKQGVAGRELREAILKVLPAKAPGLTAEEVAERLPEEDTVRRRTLLAELRRGAEATPPDWKREGEGVKGSPYTHWRKPPPAKCGSRSRV